MLDDLPSRTGVQLPAPPLNSYPHKVRYLGGDFFMASILVAAGLFTCEAVLRGSRIAIPLGNSPHLHLIHIPAGFYALSGIFFGEMDETWYVCSSLRLVSY
jgi:hypothetical protein